MKKGPADKRIFINNLPFEAKWQDVKDLFRKEVGEVSFVELFEDESGRPRGAGVLELGSAELAKQAITKMHRYEFKGRKIVVKEDVDVERDKYGRIVTDRDRERMRGGRDRSPHHGPMDFGNTYGLSTRFLESLGIDCALHTRVFVANLTYDVDEKKLKEVFRLAGKVVGIELTRDKEGKSRGFAVVVFEHPVEAVQAISMFHDQQLNDRRMTVRFDKVPEDEPPRNLNRLPDGLRGIGMGLGQDGAPLWDVKNNLPGSSNEGNILGLGNMATSMTAMPQQQQAAAAAAANTGVALQAALATIMNMASGGGNAMPQASAMSGLTGGMGMDQSVLGMSMAGSGLSGSSGMSALGSGRDLMSSASTMSDLSRVMGSMDRGMGSMDRGMDRSMLMDRDLGMSGMDRGGMGGMGGSGMDSMMRGMDSMDRMGGMGSRKSDKVVVKNLPLDITWQTLKDRFGHAGDIKFAEMRERGVGVIRFGSERDAERAVNIMNGQRLEGRSIGVSLL